MQRRGRRPRVELAVAPDGVGRVAHLDVESAASKRVERAGIWPEPSVGAAR
jgi:hypothetical protein